MNRVRLWQESYFKKSGRAGPDFIFSLLPLQDANTRRYNGCRAPRCFWIKLEIARGLPERGEKCAENGGKCNAENFRKFPILSEFFRLLRTYHRTQFKTSFVPAAVRRPPVSPYKAGPSFPGKNRRCRGEPRQSVQQEHGRGSSRRNLMRL